jgi:molybdopterin-guanine dinucleotide biosynthesis protein A
VTLARVARAGARPLRDIVDEIGARTVEIDQHELFNVNYPEDLLQATALLDRAERASRT